MAEDFIYFLLVRFCNKWFEYICLFLDGFNALDFLFFYFNGVVVKLRFIYLEVALPLGKSQVGKTFFSCGLMLYLTTRSQSGYIFTTFFALILAIAISKSMPLES